MISKTTLKDIIASNEEFIVRQIKKIANREGIYYPHTLDKTIVFYGVRRSGKTFLLFEIFKKYKDRSLYIDFEDERLVDFNLEDFKELKDAFLELKPHLIGKELVFLLDEVQNIVGWEKFCRRATERENIKVYVSGSSSKMMPSEIHTELRGRSWSIEVFPFSFREYLSVKNIDIKDNKLFYANNKIVIKKHFSEYLKWGGFPELSFLHSVFEKNKLIKEYFNAMYFRDLVERYNITNMPLLEALTDKLFTSYSLKFSLTAFYKQYKDNFSFSKDLLFRYYKHFIQSMLIFDVKKFSESTYKRTRNPAKNYLVDSGLARRVTSIDAGRLLENIVFLELKRRGSELFYFEEKRECDFLSKTDEQFLPIQVSFELNKKNKDRELAGLIEACQWLDIKDGLLLTYDEEWNIEMDKVNIKVLPVWKWLLQYKFSKI